MRILAASAFFISRPRSGPTSREPEPNQPEPSRSQTDVTRPPATRRALPAPAVVRADDHARASSARAVARRTRRRAHDPLRATFARAGRIGALVGSSELGGGQRCVGYGAQRTPKARKRYVPDGNSTRRLPAIHARRAAL